MINRILIIALKEDWIGISRLPSGLARSGFKTYALCPRKSFLAKTKYLEGAIFYPCITYSRSKIIYLWMIYAFIFYRPEVVIPGDEDALMAMQNLANFLYKIPYFNFISKIIRKSIAPQEYDAILLSKSDFQDKCRSWGLQVPKNVVVKDKATALMRASEFIFPLVIKHDTGYGGSGVFICENTQELALHFENLERQSLIDKLKKKIVSLFFVSIFGNEKIISLQQYIEGQAGLVPFCAQNGKVHALNPMLRLKTYPGKTGPSSVTCGLQNEDVENMVNIIAKNLNYTGFGSLDYMIEAKTGLAYIIELNPRPTPTCHLRSGVVTNDLCALFYRALNGEELTLNPFRPYTLALFPGEKKRDPQSVYLTTAYHDIPSDDPDLMEALDKKR